MTALLNLQGVKAWYGESQALHGMSLEVREGEVVGLIGRNGAGKSTTIKSVMGLVRASGTIEHSGHSLVGMQPHEIARRGIGWCPEERAVFGGLTVEENLQLPARVGEGMTLDRVYQAFPVLKTRAASRAGQLSGGEQQMLAIARILLAGHRLLLLDEPSEGLAPVMVDQVEDTLLALKSEGLSMLLVEQNLHLAQAVADRFYLVEHGQVIDELSPGQVRSGARDLERRLGL